MKYVVMVEFERQYEDRIGGFTGWKHDSHASVFPTEVQAQNSAIEWLKKSEKPAYPYTYRNITVHIAEVSSAVQVCLPEPVLVRKLVHFS